MQQSIAIQADAQGTAGSIEGMAASLHDTIRDCIVDSNKEIGRSLHMLAANRDALLASSRTIQELSSRTAIRYVEAAVSMSHLLSRAICPDKQYDGTGGVGENAPYPLIASLSSTASNVNDTLFRLHKGYLDLCLSPLSGYVQPVPTLPDTE